MGVATRVVWTGSGFQGTTEMTVRSAGTSPPAQDANSGPAVRSNPTPRTCSRLRLGGCAEARQAGQLDRRWADSAHFALAAAQERGRPCHDGRMSKESELDFPLGNPDERELLLSWLRFLRGAILRKVQGVSDEAAHWHPEGGLISLLGIVNHLTQVEWRWIDGSMLGEEVSRSEAEFNPGPELTVDAAVAAYRARAVKTDAVVRSMASLAQPSNRGAGRDLRWVLLHLINETARHAGHADATRELLDGTTGE